MDDLKIKKVVIVGGGTAGWIAAASLAKLLGPVVSITLVESEAIGTVGVGEATIPQIRRLNGILGLDEFEFVKETKASFKLGIEFNNWGQIGDSYLHTFGDAGINLSSLHFHQYWLRGHQAGLTDCLWDYSLHHKVAYDHKFGKLERVGNTSMTGLSYAYHFDAGLYARYLRKTAEELGANRVEGRITETKLKNESGYIESVVLENGEVIDGDIFIDCSGFRGLLIGQALGVEYVDWSNWLPCNRAAAVASKSTDPLLPYTKATAHKAGWQWRIPLQHRTGNGHVFCDQFISEDEATQTLLDNLEGNPLSDPKLLKFTTGRRESFWRKNCVSLGLASGFLEPLESTSIHLIQSNVSKLIELFPDKTFKPANIQEYNRQVAHEYDLIRDFLILHYHLTQRDDSKFWRYCRDMEVPESLKAKMELFAGQGLLYKDPEDLFRESSWVQVMLGQNLVPRSYHPMADRINERQLKEFFGSIKAIIEKSTSPLPPHQAFIDHYCKADLA